MTVKELIEKLLKLDQDSRVDVIVDSEQWLDVDTVFQDGPNVVSIEVF